MPFVTCPECDTESQAPRELIGLEWRCPGCRKRLIVDDGRPVVRRNRKQKGIPIFALVVVTALAVVALMGVQAARRGRTIVEPLEAARGKEQPAVPTPQVAVDGPPDNWTHKELAEYLASKGVNVIVHAAGLPFTSHGLPVAFLHEPPDVGQPGVMVYLCRNHQHAREFAGTMGASAFSSGRFAFGLDAVGRKGAHDIGFLQRISAALTSP